MRVFVPVWVFCRCRGKGYIEGKGFEGEVCLVEGGTCLVERCKTQGILFW